MSIENWATNFVSDVTTMYDVGNFISHDDDYEDYEYDDYIDDYRVCPEESW